MVSENGSNQITDINYKLNTYSTFLAALQLSKDSTVCIVGAGGKTSLMFKLAEEARHRLDRVLVTTSTKIMVPEKHQFDLLDLSGTCFEGYDTQYSHIYVAGAPTSVPGKMRGCKQSFVEKERNRFDLTLIEADGASRKPLKGWSDEEPVIPTLTTHTIGVLDISTIEKVMTEDLVHRIDKFSELTGCQKGEVISVQHLYHIIVHPKGLFGKAKGEKIIYVNKLESQQDWLHYQSLKKLLPHVQIFGGSIHQGVIYG